MMEDINKKDCYGGTKLLAAAAFGRLTEARRLLEHRCIDVNKCNSLGHTPLMLAAAAGNLEILKLLLSHPKININDADKKGDGALIWAAYCEEDACIEEIIKYKNSVRRGVRYNEINSV